MVVIQEQRRISFWEGVLHLLKGTAGVGMLGLAHAASKVDRALGVVILAVVTVVSFVGWWMVWQCKVAAGSKSARTYGDLAELSLGRAGRDLAEVSILFFQLACVAVYISFSATCLRALLPPAAAAALGAATTNHALVLLAMPLLLLLGTLRDLKVMTPLSLVAQVSLVTAVGIAIAQCVQYGDDHNSRTPPTPKPPLPALAPSLRGTVVFFGNCAFAVEGMSLVLPVENALTAAAQPRFGAIIGVGLALVLALYMAMTELPLSMLGAVHSPSLPAELATRGRGVAGGVAASRHMVLAHACNVLFLVNALFTLPLQFLPAAQVVDRWLWACASPAELRARDAEGAERTALLGGGAKGGSEKGGVRRRPRRRRRRRQRSMAAQRRPTACAAARRASSQSARRGRAARARKKTTAGPTGPTRRGMRRALAARLPSRRCARCAARTRPPRATCAATRTRGCTC
jgi:amino acid permease